MNAVYDYKKRRKFAINKYQRAILRLSLLPTFAFCILTTAFCLRFRLETGDLMIYGTRLGTLNMIDEWLGIIIVTIWFFFAFVYFRSVRVSGELVGSFERINNQLEKVITGEIRQPLRARDSDQLARELLQRVNILIDNLPEGKLHVR